MHSAYVLVIRRQHLQIYVKLHLVAFVNQISPNFSKSSRNKNCGLHFVFVVHKKIIESFPTALDVNIHM
jgi:hypothetical protein